MTESLLWNYKDSQEGELLRISFKKSSPHHFKSAHLDILRWCDFILKKNDKKVSIYFSIPKAWNIGERINNADASLLCARAFIPSGVWLKSPSAPGSKHYYMALCLGFSSQMGIWGLTQRQIGYQSQGWYKDRLWKSIGRQSYIGLAYLFLHHSARGPFISAESPTHKARSGPPEPDTERERHVTSYFIAPCSQHIKPGSPNRKNR